VSSETPAKKIFREQERKPDRQPKNAFDLPWDYRRFSSPFNAQSDSETATKAK